MDYTKSGTFAAFKHTEDKNTYWINCGWYYDQEVPGLFPYDTKENKTIVNDVAKNISEHWNLKNIQLVTLKVTGIINIKANEEVLVKKRGRKTKNHNALT